MEYTIVFETIILIGLMILIGIILAFFMPFNENTKQTYTILILNVGMPCIILSSIIKVEIDQNIFKNVITVFSLSLFINMIGIGWFAAIGSKQNNPSRREIV